jgi:GTPase SAR1 family protein
LVLGYSNLVERLVISLLSGNCEFNMSNKKQEDNANSRQLPLFKLLNNDSQTTYELNFNYFVEEEAIKNSDSAKPENIESNITKLEKSHLSKRVEKVEKITNLVLPHTYEDILIKIGKNKPRLPDLIIPVTQFEEQIIQIVMDITNAGYLLFLYGMPGVGKSTFISSLKFQKYIPIQEIISIDASELIHENSSNSKLKELLKQIKSAATKFFSENNNNSEKLCIAIDYLENLEDEEQNQVIAFFRDLNGLLRKYPILIIWPVTHDKDLENMQAFAKNFSSTMFHRRLPVINFTGPPIDIYPSIAKKTIMFFNEGRDCYEFQLNDNDFEELRNNYERKPREKHLIRDYLKDVISLWESRTNYISEIVKDVPKPTEVWFIFSYPEAEGVVARFAKQTPDIINEMWNADYKSLFAYISDHNQRKADWTPKRLTLALSSRMLTTKIMYLPTNALVSCIAAYAKEAKVSITREDLLAEDKYEVLKHWFGKTLAQNTLKRTPLYLQLSDVSVKVGKRKSGKVEEGLENARKAFEKFNEDIAQHRISDRCFNRAICLTLQDIFREQSNFSFQSEIQHPYLTNIRPDILVDTSEKLVCIEFCYTNDNTPGNLANYVLRKLNQYMKQLEYNFGISKDFSW